MVDYSHDDGSRARSSDGSGELPPAPPGAGGGGGGDAAEAGMYPNDAYSMMFPTPPPPRPPGSGSRGASPAPRSAGARRAPSDDAGGMSVSSGGDGVKSGMGSEASGAGGGGRALLTEVLSPCDTCVSLRH